MQTEQAPQHIPQEIQVTNLVPEQAIPAMRQALIDLLQRLPTPITITYQVGAQTEQKPFGIAMGAAPDFLDVMRFSLEAAIQHSIEAQGGDVPVV